MSDGRIIRKNLKYVNINAYYQFSSTTHTSAKILNAVHSQVKVKVTGERLYIPFFIEYILVTLKSRSEFFYKANGFISSCKPILRIVKAHNLALHTA